MLFHNWGGYYNSLIMQGLELLLGCPLSYGYFVAVGYWEENITVEECRVTQRVYAHQYYTRLLVTEIYAQRQGAATGNVKQGVLGQIM